MKYGCSLLAAWLVIWILVGVGTASAAQQLHRSSFLGLMPESVQAGDAVVVQQLYPNGTAYALGVAIGDTVNTLNGQPIPDFPTLIRVLNSINEGESITLNVTRNKAPLTLTAIAQGKPREQGHQYRVVYGDFSWQQERIRTITYYPEKPRLDGAAVLFIQGYTCGSIDYGMLPEVSLNQLLGSYAQAGFTVMKMEKPGVGDSEGKLDCQQYDFVTENQAFLAGLKHFKQLQAVNADNTFVFGHSLGVLHAAIIAEQGLAKGVIGYGGAVKRWIDYMHDIYAKQSVLYWGVSKEQAQENVSIMSPFLTKWLNSEVSWSELSASNAAKRVASENLLILNNEQIFDRHFTFFRSVNRIDFETLWKGAKSHALMLHGKFDIQAIDGDWAKQVVSLVNQNINLRARAIEFERTDHSLLQFDNKTDLMKFTRRQDSGLGKFNTQIASDSIAWMQDILAQQITSSSSR